MLRLNEDVLLETIRQSAVFQTVGRVDSADSMLTVKMPATVGHLCQIESRDQPPRLAEVIGFQGDIAKVMTFAPIGEMRHGDRVRNLGRKVRIPSGEGMLGRVIDCLGNPVDDRGPIHNVSYLNAGHAPPQAMKRHLIEKVMETGQKSIDCLLTMGIGQRMGLFAGSGVGKSTLLGDVARYASADLNVVALVGERGREVRPFIEQALGEDGLSRSVVVVALADETPLARVRAGETAVTIAESFRESGKSVLLMFDSLTRWCMSQRELGLMLGEPPTSRGYTPGVFQKLAVLLERLGNSDRGSITALLTVLIEGDDVNDPVADAARGILDGHIVLSRELAATGHFPSIDISASTSRVFIDIAGIEHQAIARAAREIISIYRNTEDLISVGAWQRGRSPQTDLAVDLYSPLMQFLRQDIRSPETSDSSLNQLKQILTPWLDLKSGGRRIA